MRCAAWKVRDPDAREFIGVGAFNLIRRSAYNAVGTFASLRLAVVDDLQLGQIVKQARLRQDVVVGPNLVSLRWAQGAFGVVRNLEKNLFAFFGFRMALVILACFAVLFSCVWPFVGLLFAPGWTRAPFALAVALIVIQHVLTRACVPHIASGGFHLSRRRCDLCVCHLALRVCHAAR